MSSSPNTSDTVCRQDQEATAAPMAAWQPELSEKRSRLGARGGRPAAPPSGPGLSTPCTVGLAPTRHGGEEQWWIYSNATGVTGPSAFPPSRTELQQSATRDPSKRDYVPPSLAVYARQRRPDSPKLETHVFAMVVC